jgi:hypothetical protein
MLRAAVSDARGLTRSERENAEERKNKRIAQELKRRNLK